MKTEFEGVIYNDDRMFVLYLCRCTIRETEDSIVTTIHHTQIPEDYVWSVITFRNNERYTAVKVNHFRTQDEAIQFISEIEPHVPLISLNGHPPVKPLPYHRFLEWKQANGFQEYDYKKMFPADAVNPSEKLYQPKS